MMSKKDAIKVFLLVVLAVVSSIVIYNNFNNESNNDKPDEKIEITEDEKKFKEEYESLNNKKDSNDKDYLEVSIKDDNGIVYASYDEIRKVLTEGTGVVYLGYPECNGCRNAVPMLLEAASNQGLDTIYYLNALDIIDSTFLDENCKVITGTDEYYDLIEIFGSYYSKDTETTFEYTRVFFFPTVVFVKDGEILGIHMGTTGSQTNPNEGLTEEQKIELFNIYMDYISKMLGSVCDERC